MRLKEKKHFRFQVRLQWGDNWWTNSNDRWSRSKESGAECKKLAKTPECPITSLGLFVTESLLCCHHGIDWPGTLCRHMKSWNCPLGDPPAITCWINFPLSRTFVRNAHSRARGTEDRGRVGRKHIAAGAIIASTINSDLHFDFCDTSILNIGILTSKARRRKMTMMALTLGWTTSTTTT